MLSPGNPSPRDAAPPTLKRALNFWQVTASGVGIVIGAGIYVLIGEAAQDAGAAVWLSFIIGAVLAGLTGLSYAELAGMYPSAGAEYEFARRAFNEFIGFVTGWMMVAALLVAAGAVSLGFGFYLNHFVDIDQRVAAVALLAGLTVLVIAGIERSIWLTVLLAIFQIGGLVFVIAIGLPHVGDRSLTDGADVPNVLSAAALIFFAFVGFDEVVTLSEETHDASRTIPRALLAALAISTGLYVLVGLAAVSVVGAEALAASDRPLALVVDDVLGSRSAGFLALIAVASTMNTTLIALTAASRNLFGMSRSGSLPRFISALGTETRAPYFAALFGLVVSASFAATGDIGEVASVTNFSVYGIFIVVNLSLIALRFSAPAHARPFRVPGAIGAVPVLPILAIATTALMVVYLDPIAWIIGFGANGLAVITWLALAAVARLRRRHADAAGAD
jgi:APA family basic amino acid/polyamine antiporter